ncbi:DUF4389 domain-containing protein [Gammaproteobacteria bacterium]|nr:DUF4389 domain-containing protein [Gammaproteobacteria bacterium]
MNKKSEENKEVGAVVETEAVDGSIDTESLKENFLQQGKWLRLLWIIGFSFIYFISLLVLGLIVTVQFLFVLLTNSPNENILRASSGFRNYMVQILDFITYRSEDKPFPFSDFPS